jgi:malonyl-CoA/methylmalonyl-CoA synthetase
VIETLPALFARRAPDPGTPLMVVPGSETWTYGDVHGLAGRIANGLTTAGVAPGDRVAVQVEKCPEVVALYLACLRSGAVFFPMNPAYTDDEVAYLVDDATPRVVVREPAALAALADGQPGSFDDVTVRPDDVAAMLYTSGTTGRPKGVPLTHRNLAANAASLHEVWGFGPDDVLLHALPVFHAHGLFVALNCVLTNGTGMVFLPRFDVDAVIDQLPSASVFMGVPTHYTRLLADSRLDRDRCSSVRLFVSGSAPLLATTHEQFRERTGHTILERYGMTETVMIASNPLEGTRKPGSVGRPLPDVEVRISNAENGVGDVEVRGPSVFSGYWQRPELTATEFTADGYFRTGDLGSIDDDGYLHLVGRSKDLVITGGLNVYPTEVEAALDQLQGVAESAVIGVPDPDYGEAVVAVVVPAEGADPDPEELRSNLRARLANYKIPKRIILTDALPRNAMGKVEKTTLRAQLTTEDTPPNP